MIAGLLVSAALAASGCEDDSPAAAAGAAGRGAGGDASIGGTTGQSGGTGAGGSDAAGAAGGTGIGAAGGSGAVGAAGGPGVGSAGVSGNAGSGSDPRCAVAWAGDVQLGTAQDDQLLGMTIGDDGNLIVSGYEQGVVGVTNIEPDGNARAVVMKLTPTGTIAWKTVLDTPATDTAEDVAVDPATGNLVVVGRTSGAFAGFDNQGQFDLFLALLDRDGGIATVFQTGNERPQHPVRLSLAPGGGVFVAGWDDTYIPTNYVAANQDGFVGAFGIDPGPGHAVTETSMHYTFPPAMTGPFSLATGVAAERDGSGVAYVTTLVASSRSLDNGISVTKLRGDRTVAWDDVISPTAFDAVNAVALSPSGDLFVTGGTFRTLGAQAFGQEDGFVMKLDKATGAPIWTAQAGGPDSDYPTAIAFDAAGNIYIAGITLGSVTAGVPNQGSVDVFAMKFSPAGDLLSVWQAGTAADDELTSMAVDRCGNVLVGGYTRGALVPGRTNAGGEDIFVMKAAL